MNSVGVSILVLAYNHELYISDAIEGFLKQKTEFPFEIIIHEDASTDRTAEIIRQYQELHPNIIKVIYQEENQYSKGVNINDKYLLPLASGKYIALCDGDDYWIDPLKLQKQYDALEANPSCLMCIHRVIDFDVNSTHHQTEKYLPYRELQTGIMKSRDFFKVLGDGEFFNEVSYFFKAKEYKEYQHDYPYFASLYMKNKTDDAPMLNYFGAKADVYYISDVMAIYRRFTNGSWSSQMQKKGNDQKLLFFKNVVEAQAAFMEFSEHKFDTELHYNIMYFKFNYAYYSKNYIEMLEPAYNCVWEKQPKSFYTRIKLIAKYPSIGSWLFRLYDFFRK